MWSYAPDEESFAIRFMDRVIFFVSLEVEAKEFVQALNDGRKTIETSVGAAFAPGNKGGQHTHVEAMESALLTRRMRQEQKGY